MEKITKVGFPEWFVEVHSVRGNFSQFFLDAAWPEVSVWDLRKLELTEWEEIAHDYYEEFARVGVDVDNATVVRYPHLEQNLPDVPYHPSVPAWYVDIDKVKEHFKNV